MKFWVKSFIALFWALPSFAIFGTPLSLDLGTSKAIQGELDETTKISVSVEIGQTSINEKQAPIEISWWGASNGQKSAKIIKSLRVLVNSKPIVVPPSSISFLTDIHKMGFEKHGDEILIAIIGGDASTGYEATLKVKNERVVERTVRSGEFRDLVWEKTIYHNEVMDNPNSIN